MRTQGRGVGLAAAVLALVAALAGCGAGVDGDDAGGEAAAAPGHAAEEPAADPGYADAADAEGAQRGGESAQRGGTGAEDPTGGEAGGTGWVDQRSIIYTGSITVRVEDVDTAAARASALAARLGGFVGADTRTRDDDRSYAELVLRIPSAQFTDAVDDLGELGDEEAREIHTQDVTEEVVDLGTRIATAEASVARTRALLDRADTIAEIVAVEAELSTREERLAGLQARKRELADLTTLSTITVELRGPEAPEVVAEPETGFVAGLEAGWRTLVVSLKVLLTVLGALLPWLLAFGLPTAAAWWWWHRRRSPRPAPAPAEVAPPQRSPVA